MQRVAINGFGRIGRNVLRAWFEGDFPHIDIVAINDISDIDTLAHLFTYDSTHGRFAGSVEIILQNQQQCLDITLGEKHLKIQVFQQHNPQHLPWNHLNIDAVLECTGLFRSRHDAEQHLTAGAKRVIIGAAPFDSVDAAIVYGVNHQQLKAEHRVISSVSCTTQALVPLVKILDDAFGIESALMTEIHAVTTDQAVLDRPHRDLRRARASGFNIVPTTSSALGALKRIFPHMQNRIEGYSIRVPTINVAAIDLTVLLSQAHTAEEINQKLIAAGENTYQHIMSWTKEPLVSSDFNHSPYSLIVDTLQTMTVGRQAKVFAWYDNEWGYANRLLDLVGCLDGFTP